MDGTYTRFDAELAAELTRTGHLNLENLIRALARSPETVTLMTKSIDQENRVALLENKVKTMEQEREDLESQIQDLRGEMCRMMYRIE